MNIALSLWLLATPVMSCTVDNIWFQKGMLQCTTCCDDGKDCWTVCQ